MSALGFPFNSSSGRLHGYGQQLKAGREGPDRQRKKWWMTGGSSPSFPLCIHAFSIYIYSLSLRCRRKAWRDESAEELDNRGTEGGDDGWRQIAGDAADTKNRREEEEEEDSRRVVSAGELLILGSRRFDANNVGLSYSINSVLSALVH